MIGEIVPVHRKALLNALKTAARLDPERLDEMLQAAQNSFVQMGWDTAEDLWTFGPLLEIAGRMARETDQVNVRLPALAKSLHDAKVVSPERFGVDFNPDQSIALSLLSLTARMERLIERERFGQTPEWCRKWITEVVLSSATHLYGALEEMDAAASVRADVGAEGKQMVLQAAIRESMNILENAWRVEARDFAQKRTNGTLVELREWLSQTPKPENQALSRILERTGEKMDDLLGHLQVVRGRVKSLQERLRKGGTLDVTVEQSSSGHGPATAPEKQERPAQNQATVHPAKQREVSESSENTGNADAQANARTRSRFGRRR